MSRWCPTGNHFTATENFRQLASGKHARDCRQCEGQRARRTHRKDDPRSVFAEHPCAAPTRRFPGVDIDAIHRKRRVPA